LIAEVAVHTSDISALKTHKDSHDVRLSNHDAALNDLANTINNVIHVVDEHEYVNSHSL
jgi:hypothetical protein